MESTCEVVSKLLGAPSFHFSFKKKGVGAPEFWAPGCCEESAQNQPSGSRQPCSFTLKLFTNLIFTIEP